MKRRTLLDVLSSMSFAIMLLVVIAIASVIGTILQQNKPYQDYIIKFGPYWHEVYKTLGLYDVYSSLWFVGILSFLVLTTSVCIYRNGPQMLRALQRFNEVINEKTLLAMPVHQQWTVTSISDDLQQVIEKYLHHNGYRTRSSHGKSHVTIAAMTGSANRWGYLLTHLAIVVICIGGLLDGNLPLKVRQITGDIKIETRDLGLSEIPAESRLPPESNSFRASVSIPEGARVDYAFINMAGGYLLQHLPFAVKVMDFNIEHYSSGQPKSFTSKLEIHDPELKESFTADISVNHPLFYKGYAIYQSSFADGGTRLKLRLKNLLDEKYVTSLDAVINRNTTIDTAEGTLQLEFNDFRPFNIFPAGESERKFIDYGPNFTYKLRNENGQAYEYVNYQNPFENNGRYYFLSGVRKSPEEEFQYLYIPLDENESTDRFFNLQNLLFDEIEIEKILTTFLQTPMDTTMEANDDFEQNIRQAMLKVLAQFRQGGTDVIAEYSQSFDNPEQNRAAVATYMQLLHTAMQALFLSVLEKEGVSTTTLNKSQEAFFNDAISALNASHYYDSPFILELESYEHRQASGLQITRTPGKKLVYSGFIMLIAGVFLLFYIHHQRLWLRIQQQDNQVRIILAGSRARHQREFNRLFAKLANDLKVITGNRD